MADKPSPPSRQTPRPPALPRRTTPALKPSPPGPVAGNPIGKVVREATTEAALPSDLPPNIPPHMAGIIATPRGVAARGSGVPSAPAAPTRPLHPSFAPADEKRRMQRKQAEDLRNTALGAATFLRAHVSALKGQLAAVKATPEGIAAAEAEGLDLGHLGTFLESLQVAESLTVGAEPAPVPEPPETSPEAKA